MVLSTEVRGIVAEPRRPVVQTVLGAVSPTALAHTQPHEHVLCDFSALSHGNGDEPITLEHYQRIRRNPRLSRSNLRLVSEADAVAELSRFRGAGGGTIADLTPRDAGRDPDGLARISRTTGVHVVMGSGYYVRTFHPPVLAGKAEEHIAEEITRDVVDGVGDSGIRAGVIGEIGLSWPVHPVEERVLRAAARAQIETGAALAIHPGRDPAAPLAALRVVDAAGGDLGRTIVCHVERTLFSLDAMLQLAATGCYLEFDLFGHESSHYHLAPIDMPNDAVRVDYLLQLAHHGYGDKLLVSQDVCTKVRLTRYGGEGYHHLLEHVVPMMRRKGMTTTDVELLTRHNPAAVLTLP
jgi:phosphotriesterase-related protein